MFSNRISDLAQDLQPLCAQFLAACNAQFIPSAHVILVCTYRSVAEQQALKNKYGTSRRVAAPGKSLHGKTLSDGTPAAQAFDAMAVENGKLVENSRDPLYIKMGEIARSIGLAQPFPLDDANHFQLA